jgi:phosphopantothenoylcysteine decarboxylase/phosphopantothenate--cysteine ligase
MAKILITSGPTRQYIDPVRYISNASSGMMGRCLASAAIDAGHDVTIVSGPVNVDYPKSAKLINVVSTEDMLKAAEETFRACDGMIGAAAPCDYRPVNVADHKIKKSGDSLNIKLVETPDIVATLGKSKRDDQWSVGFALETEDARFRAITKLQKKCCDLVVLNGASAIESANNSVEIIAPTGEVIDSIEGSKKNVAEAILNIIGERLVLRQR